MKRLIVPFVLGIIVGILATSMLVFPLKVFSGFESLAGFRKCNEAVDQYTADRKAPPKSINEMVQAGYLKNADYPAKCIPIKIPLKINEPIALLAK